MASSAGKPTAIASSALKHLKADGVAGPKTLDALDQALLAQQGSAPKIPPKPAPSSPKVPPPHVPVNIEDLNYKIGTVDPPLARDAGAGVWNSKPLTFSAVTQAAGIVAATKSGATRVYPGSNATKHMEHYFENTGRDYTIDLEDMIRSTNRARQTIVAEALIRFVQLLPPGTHRFTSKTAESSYNYQNETNDWYFAIGGYSYWGKGIATITETGGQRVRRRIPLPFLRQVQLGRREAGGLGPAGREARPRQHRPLDTFAAPIVPRSRVLSRVSAPC